MGTFVYPKNGNFSLVAPSNLINIYDALEVTYTSTWPKTNVTVFCQSNTNAGSSSYLVWQADNNPLAASGTYRIDSIYALLKGHGDSISSYPVWCSVKLTKYGNNDEANGGDNFRVVSSGNQSATYRLTATATSSVTVYVTPSATSDSTTATASIASTSIPFSSTVSSAAASIPSNQSSSADTGLSTGAKAGIGIGAAAIVILVGALCFIILRLRRKARAYKGQAEIKETTGPWISSYGAPNDYKPAPSQQLTELEENSRVELPSTQTSLKPKGAPVELQ